MWTRKELKDYAKRFLSGNFGKAYLVAVIAYGITSIINGVVDWIIPLESNTSGLNFLTTAIIGLLITAPLQTGSQHFYLEGFKSQDRLDIENVFFSFKSGYYFNIIKTHFIMGLYILLWTLLLIIPGIVKSYQYRMVSYILAEDPSTPTSEALKRSKDMTYGHKWEIFGLDLSFIGWGLLVAIGIGILSMILGPIYLLSGINIVPLITLLNVLLICLILPYISATNARLYNVLSNKDKFKEIGTYREPTEEDLFNNEDLLVDEDILDNKLNEMDSIIEEDRENNINDNNNKNEDNKDDYDDLDW